jgi:hypothetical protein
LITRLNLEGWVIHKDAGTDSDGYLRHVGDV